MKHAFVLGGALVAMFAVSFAPAGSSSRLPEPFRAEGIVIHHTATSDWMLGHPVDAAAIDKIHRSLGFGVSYRGRLISIGYHWLVFPNGLTERGRPETLRGAHVRGDRNNERLIGVALVGDFDSRSNPRGEFGRLRPTPEQLLALQNLLRQIVLRHPNARSVWLHSELCATRCPGDRFSQIHRTVAIGQGGG